MSARCPAISARRRRRISSSLLPLNIGPQTTSSQPPARGCVLITRESVVGAQDDGRKTAWNAFGRLDWGAVPRGPAALGRTYGEPRTSPRTLHAQLRRAVEPAPL